MKPGRAATAISLATGRRTLRFLDAVTSGLLAGMASMAVLHIAAIVRVDVFLEQIRDREDWVNLISRFHASGFQSLRTYANYEYVRQFPILLMLGAVVGGFCGTLGGAINGILRAPAARLSR